MTAAPSPARGNFELDAVVIGGCGHVGLPLAIALASRGARVGIYDVSQAAVDTVNADDVPSAPVGSGSADPQNVSRLVKKW